MSTSRRSPPARSEATGLGAAVIGNTELAELLAAASATEARGSNRQKALARASVAALFWPEEAATLGPAGRSLTELVAVGPYVAARLEAWLEGPEPVEVPAPPPSRRGFRSVASARAVVAAHPEWNDVLRADFQMHTTDSDGRLPLDRMVAAAQAQGYSHIAITDHTKGLRIANGMDEDRLAAQAVRIAELNARLSAEGGGLRVLHGVEMNLSPQGEGDMDPVALGRLDIVLGAFHSDLRRREDQTDRYLRALDNPDIHVLAHPRTRMWDRREGLAADWRAVLEAAAERGKAVEVDCHPHRQDLDVETLRLAAEIPVWISVGSDAHSAEELPTTAIALAALIEAGIPRERVINCLGVDELLAWTGRG